MKTNKLALLIGLLLSALASTPFAASSIAYDNDPLTEIIRTNSGYHENIYFGNSREHFSQSTHEFPIIRNQKFYDDYYGSYYATASAEVNSRNVPYVKTSAKSSSAATVSGEDIDVAYGEATSYAQIGYRLNIYGAANSIVPIKYSAAYELNGIKSLGSQEYSTFSSVGLRIIELSNPDQSVIQAFTSCDTVEGNCKHYSDYSFGESELDAYDGGEVDSYDAIAKMTISANHTSTSFKSTFSGTVNVLLDDSGIGTILVGIASSSEAEGDGSSNTVSLTNAFIDPFFTVDESYLALNPNTSILLPEGVGNTNPLNATTAVPEPETYLLIFAGLALLAASRRRQFTFTSLKTT